MIFFDLVLFAFGPPTKPSVFFRTQKTGWISENRVNGNLALSRALGDFVFKRNEKRPPEDQIVTAVPDIEMRKVTDGNLSRTIKRFNEPIESN